MESARIRPEPVRSERVLGHIEGTRPGPTFVAIGGLHGNEPAGVRALERVVRHLTERPELLAGEFIGVAGNLTALERGSRYVDRDLNRIWTPARVRALGSGREPGTDIVEYREQRELWMTLESIFSRARGPVYILDLHTTSGPGAPFALIEDALRNRRLALALPVPLVLGLEEHLEGTLLAYVNSRGHPNLGFEAGSHADPTSVDHAEAAVWVALESTGNLPASGSPITRDARSLLRRSTATLPRIVDVQYHHAITVEDRFQMRPGFVNLQRVRQGQIVARDRRGDVRTNRSGRILMPLYQRQGEDGFFLVRQVRMFWLRLSALLRYARIDTLAHWLPAVERDPRGPGRLLVDPARASRLTYELLHLLGFRRQRPVGDRIVVTRRRD